MKVTRLIVGAILGVVLTVAVYSAGRSLCIIHSGREHRIPIGPRAKDIPADEAEAHISAGKNHQITWQSTNKKLLLIEFERAALPNGMDPFKNMTDSPDGPFRRVYCSGDECRSDEINDTLKTKLGPFTCLKFKYDQQIGTDRADGWIIIEP